jgi:hypothetical protein
VDAVPPYRLVQHWNDGCIIVGSGELTVPHSVLVHSGIWGFGIIQQVMRSRCIWSSIS